MHRSSISLLLAIVAVAFGTSACVSPGSRAAFSRGPYLQQAASDSVVVVWRTQGAINPVVRFGSAPGALTSEVRGDAITLRVSADVQAAGVVPRLFQEAPEEVAEREADHDPSTPANTYQYEARVSGLQPNTKYFYSVHDGDRLLAGGDAGHYFVSHPPIGSESDMRIWVVGDSGTGGKEQAMVHDAMIAYVAGSGRPIDHYIHVGDMAYSDGTDREFQDHFFAPYQSTLRNTVCWPTLGNHEGHTSRGMSGTGPYFDAYVVPMAAEAGGVPSGTEAYFSFDISDIHFICLDSHDLDRGPAAAMAQWLRADLEQTKAKWLIAFWHHPPYSMGSHNSDRERQLIEMRENFMPILESAGVDLTLTGHSHIYERSMLIDGAYATPTTAKGVILDDGDGNPDGDGAYRKSERLQPNEGSVAVVAGHGGAGMGREGTMPVMRQIILEHGSVILDIKGDTLKGIMLNKNGVTRDIFSIVKRGKVTPTRVANPWQPVHDISLLTEIRTEFAAMDAGAAPEGWSVAHGNKSGMVVAMETGGQKRVLRVQSDKEPIIGLFTPWKLRKFDAGAEFLLPAGNRSGAGLVFGYVDAGNNFRVYLDVAAGAVRLSRFVNGTETVIEERKVAITSGKSLELEIEVGDGGIDVQFDGGDEELEFAAKLGADYPPSPVGFIVPANSVVEFHSFAIENNDDRP
ncbi:MAG TPA: metallophosphoesterase family protein [Opitutaceae bacterium]